MRVAVAGGTGLTGREVVRAVRAAGHEAVVMARATGVDLATGAGLDAALAGVDAVVDVTSADTAAEFARLTGTLLAGCARAGVRHVVLLSIVAAPRLPERPHYAGKLEQERRFAASGLPYSIVRATQYHEFGAMMAEWERAGDEVVLPEVMLQPVAVRDVGDVLAELAVGTPLDGVIELAGPERMRLADCARRVLAARGDRLHVVDAPADPRVAVDAFLPAPGARIAPTTFSVWLRGQGAGASEHPSDQTR